MTLNHFSKIDPIIEKAKELFKVKDLYPYQRLAIANILEGVNQIVVIPTAGGKSLCFQLPSQLLEGPTLVIVPLLSLLADQLRRLKELNIKCGAFKGGQTKEERKELFNQLKQGQVKIVFATPEILQSPQVSAILELYHFSHIAIDEAHCVTEWGESFRPAYLLLGEVIEKLNPAVITAFTATASQRVISRIRALIFKLDPVNIIQDIPDRPNIIYSVMPVLSKSRALVKLCKELKFPLVVFTRSRKGAELYARLLKRCLAKRQVYFYHAGLYKEERQKIEDWFLPNKQGILISTSAYGMGMDKPDIRTIIHIDVPYSVEGYLQESGRAGRDGKTAQAILVYSTQDLHYGLCLKDDLQKRCYERLLQYVYAKDRCRREYLLALLGWQIEHCSGCDYCKHNIITEPEGKEQILRFITKWPRRFSIRECIQIFSGKRSYDVEQKELDRFSAFALLKHWEQDDIAEAIKLLIDFDKIALPQRGFFKQRLKLK